MLAILVITEVLLLSARGNCQPVAVSRGRDRDTLLISQNGTCSEHICSPPDVTYLVGDRVCVKDFDIRNQCEYIGNQKLLKLSVYYSYIYIIAREVSNNRQNVKHNFIDVHIGSRMTILKGVGGDVLYE